MKISHSQMAKLEIAVLEPFYKEVYQIVVDSCKEATASMSESEICEQIKSEYQVSRKLKIKSKRGVVRFIGLSFLFGCRFYVMEEYSRIFNKDNKDIDRDIDLLFD